MSDFLSRSDELKIRFSETPAGSEMLSSVRAQVDEMQETTVDPIEISLIVALRKSMLKQTWRIPIM